MIRLFWIGIIVVVDLFCIYAMQFNLSSHLPHKKLKTKAYHDHKTGEIIHYEGDVKKMASSSEGIDINQQQQYYGPPPNHIHHHHNHKPSYYGSPYSSVVVSSPSGTAPLNFPPVIGGIQQSNTNISSYAQDSKVLYEHWHLIYYKTICAKKTWVLSFDVFCWVWWIFYACSLVALFTFWWQSNDLPDFPQIDQFTNSYDLVLLFLVIIRFLSSSWYILFWGSYGEIWWLRIAWLSIFCSFGLGIATLYFMFFVNVLSFGFYCAYVVWLAFVVYYAGTFLNIAYKMRKCYRNNKIQAM